MSPAIPFLLAFLLPATPPDNFFGDFNRRSAAAVAADLNSVSRLPTAAFDAIAPSVLQIVREARARGVSLTALDVYSSSCGEGTVQQLLDYLNQCLDAAAADPDLRVKTTFWKILTIEDFVGRSASNWSPALRRAPGTIAFLSRVARFTERELDPSISFLAVDTLMDILPDDAARRSLVLDLIRVEAPGVLTNSFDPELLSDAASLQTLRGIASQPGFNSDAFRVLSHLGDTATLALLAQKRAEGVQSDAHSTVSLSDEYTRRINLQHPASRLLDYLREPDDSARFQAFAIQRALELGLDRSQIQSALIHWESHWTGSGWYVISMHQVATRAGLLNSAGQPTSAPASFDARSVFRGGYERRSGPIEVPDRRPKQKRWKPNNANWDAFLTWFRSVNWRGMSDAEAVRRWQQKMCELDLLSPDACDEIAASQPATP